MNSYNPTTNSALPTFWEAGRPDGVRVEATHDVDLPSAFRVFEKAAVTAAVARWNADALETAIVERGGAAATMRSIEAWRAHPK